MKFFRTLSPKTRAQTSTTGVPREVLPDLHAFVDVALGGDHRRESISIDEFSFDTFTIRAIAGLGVGRRAYFFYRNNNGEFRFSAVCTALGQGKARFTIPARVETLSTYSGKRTAVRLQAILPIHWRYAPGGLGNGDFFKASLSDLSLGGAALVVARELRTGTQVEVCFTLKTAPRPLVVLSEVMRAAKIEASGKNLVGIRFVNVHGTVGQAINKFIHERQILRRNRGMV
jgi:hypothetical protein